SSRWLCQGEPTPGGASTSSRQYCPPVSSALVLIVTRAPNSQKSSPSSSRNAYPSFARSLDVVVDMKPPSFPTRTACQVRCHPVTLAVATTYEASERIS